MAGIRFKNIGYDKTFRVDSEVYSRVVLMSDIHGEYNKYLKMKAVLNNFEGCLVGCLGDIVDRGPDSPALLKEFMNPQGFDLFMILGNHEWMLLDYLLHDRPENKPYYYNTGMQLRGASDEEIESIIAWIQSLPLSLNLEIAGQTYELSHASIVDYQNYDPEDLIWCSRVRRLLFSGESILRLRGTCAVLGHNPTRMIRDWVGAEKQRGSENDIFSIGNRLFFVDCGCGKPDAYGNNKLGALVIDTKTGQLSEVYVE